jgi:hypothetical protein
MIRGQGPTSADRLSRKRPGSRHGRSRRRFNHRHSATIHAAIRRVRHRGTFPAKAQTAIVTGIVPVMVTAIVAATGIAPATATVAVMATAPVAMDHCVSRT